MPKDNAKDILKDIIGKPKNLYFVRRGNSSILYSLRATKNLGCKTIIIPDQGGWITYEQYPDKLKMNLVRVKTDSSQIILDELESVLKENPDSAFILINKGLIEAKEGPCPTLGLSPVPLVGDAKAPGTAAPPPHMICP